MKKILIVGAGILAFLVVAALVAPFLVNLNDYKTQIQAKAREATGRDIIINGDIRIGLLPSPYARLTDVVIANPAGTKSESFATIKAIDVGVALGPLLSRQIQVTHIDITEPAVTLEVMANGDNNWQFKPQSVAKTEDKTEEATTAPTQLSIDNLNLEKAFIRYVDVPGQSQQTIGPINGNFNIASLSGPVSGKGEFTVSGKLPIKFEATVESLPSAANKSLPFHLTLNILNDAAKADFKGAVETGDAVNARVDSAIAVSDLRKILGRLSKNDDQPELPAFLAGKASFNGLIDYKNDHAVIDNLMIRAGNAELSGSINAALADRKSLTLDIKNVVLPPDVEQRASPAPGTGKQTAQNLAATLRDGFAKAAGLLDTALPKLPMDVIVTAAQLPLPNQPVLRDLRLAASSSVNGLTLQDAQAKLPGNTTVQLDGMFPSRADGMIDRVTLNAKVSTQNLQAALGKDGPASGPMTAVQTTINLTRDSLYLKPLQIAQSGQSVQGDIVYNPKADKALVVTLKGNALDLDSLLAKTDPSITAPVKNVKATENPVVADPLTRLQGLKALVTADIGSVTFRQKTARNVAMQLDLSDKGLGIPRATVGDLGGMQIAATGSVGRLSPLGDVDVTVTGKTPNLSQTLRSLGNGDAANLGASQFDAKLNGSASDLNVAMNGTIDQGKIVIGGVAKDINASPSFTGRIDVGHPETATILRNFAGQKPSINLGPFALQGNLTYGAETLKADNISVKLGSAGTVTGHVNVTPDGATRRIDADLRADKLALAALLGDDTQTSAAAVNTSQPKATDKGWSNEAINLSSLRNLNGKANVQIGELLYKKFIINNFRTTLNFANNAIALDTLGGNLFGAGDFNINGQLAPGAENQAHRGDFSITLDKVDAPKLFVALGSKPFNKGVIDLNQKIGFNGASPAAIIASLNGDGQLKVTDGVVNGLDLDALAAKLDRPNSLGDFAAIMDQARAGGETAISNVTMPIIIRNGVVQVRDTAITTQKTKMDVGGTVNLPPRQVDLTGQITFVEQRNLPPLTLFVRGPMSDPQKSFDISAFTKFYALKATEKLRENVGNKLNKLLGVPETTAAPDAASPATGNVPPATTPGVASPTTPTPPVSPAPVQEKTSKDQRNDALKQLGGQMLNNILGGGR